MPNSSLYDEHTFYPQFIHDLLQVKQEVIIESPYITSERMRMLFPVLEKLVNCGIKVIVITRDPSEHSEILEQQSEVEIQRFEELGIHTLLCLGNHHRKLALLDRKILWEGSLNILSQTKSREIMRRIESREWASQTFEFLNLGAFIQKDTI